MPMRDTARSLPWSVPARPEGRSVGERGGAGPAAHAPQHAAEDSTYGNGVQLGGGVVSVGAKPLVVV
jgi:hypothetical protein